MNRSLKTLRTSLPLGLSHLKRPTRGQATVYALFALGALMACSSEPPGNEQVPIDANGDGVADDLGGTPLDTNNDGIWDGIDINGDNVSDGTLLDTNNDGIFDAIDTDGDNTPDIMGSGGASDVVTGSGGRAQGTGNAPGSGGGSVVGGGGTGSGSSSGAGGVPNGTGGATGDGDGDGGFQETGTMASCTFMINGVPATEMPTVGVVDFTVTGLSSTVTGGVIQFGLDTNYKLEAPLDVQAANYKTLMLGMKQKKAYHYRIGVSTGSEYCYSPDTTIQSGSLRNGVAELSNKSVTGTVAPGFMVTAAGNTATIYDKDGDAVWGYAFTTGGAGGIAGIFSAKMSYDGKHMIARDLGPFDETAGGKFFRVSMDGSGLTDFDAKGGDHHDFTILPGNKIAYIAKETKGTYDKIYVIDDDGKTEATALVDLKPFIDAYPQTGTEKSHVNAIHYWPERKIYTLSNRESDGLIVVSDTGQFVMGIGKEANASFPTITAEGTSGGNQVWRVQHGHDLYEDNKLLVFSNGNMGMGSTSHVLHYTISGETATKDWEYTAMGSSGTQGDVQMLPNGNVLITSSNTGNIHEIDSSQKLVASYKSGSFGYVTHRPTLYGPPPQGR